MEATKKSKTKKSTTEPNEITLKKAYKDYVLTEGKRPASVYKFAKENGLSEVEFYKHFASFLALEKAIWNEYILSVRSRMESDEAYPQFSAREKILTFYFSLVELLKAERSFVVHQLHEVKNPTNTPVFLRDFKHSFEEWITGILNEGKGTGEIANRPFLDTRYDSLFWLHLHFILQFWSKDESTDFEKTDAAIEKSVTLAFDLIGKGALDNAIDFGKFLFQNRKS